MVAQFVQPIRWGGVKSVQRQQIPAERPKWYESLAAGLGEGFAKGVADEIERQAKEEMAENDAQRALDLYQKKADIDAAISLEEHERELRELQSQWNAIESSLKEGYVSEGEVAEKKSELQNKLERLRQLRMMKVKPSITALKYIGGEKSIGESLEELKAMVAEKGVLDKLGKTAEDELDARWDINYKWGGMLGRGAGDIEFVIYTDPETGKKITSKDNPSLLKIYNGLAGLVAGEYNTSDEIPKETIQFMKTRETVEAERGPVPAAPVTEIPPGVNVEFETDVAEAIKAMREGRSPVEVYRRMQEKYPNKTPQELYRMFMF